MTIELFGEIVSDEWTWVYELFGIPFCCPRQVRDAIKDLPEDETLVLEINSPGGDVWAGFEIYGLLQKIAARTEAHIVALAASAATTVTSACKKVLASPVAQIMIHQPVIYVEDYINNDGARELRNFLDSVKASILNGYVVKSAGKASRKRFEQLVDDSTWMPAQDAIDLGLVDGYLDLDDKAAAAITASGVLRVTNAAGLSPAPKSLLERYEAAVRAGAMQPVPGHPVSHELTEGRNEPADALLSDEPDAVIVGQLVDNWRFMAAIELERARDAV